MKTRTALFTGRFQPPTIAHAATVLAILERWERVVIGVSDVNLGARRDVNALWRIHIEATAEGFSPAKYIFDSREVVLMWAAWVADSGLADRVLCKPVPRPFFSEFSLMFPPEEYDFVIPQVQSDSSFAERTRKNEFPKLLGLSVFEISPSLVLHNSEIRTYVANGRSWSEFIAPGAYEVFMDVGGPARIRRADEARGPNR